MKAVFAGMIRIWAFSGLYRHRSCRGAIRRFRTWKQLLLKTCRRIEVRVKIVVVGHKGQLGTDLILRAQRKKMDAVGTGKPQCDLTDADSVIQTLAEAGTLDVVINAAAYTAVDQAQRERKMAFAVNDDGAGHLARACSLLNIPLIHISSDYVFEGLQTKPYQPDDAIGPQGVYARSKAQGEAAVRRHLERHVIMRVSWLFGQFGRNFVTTMLRLGKERKACASSMTRSGHPPMREIWRKPCC